MFLMTSQCLHFLSATGVLGLVCRPLSVSNVCELQRNLAMAPRYRYFITRYEWGSITYSYLIIVYVFKRGCNIVFCICVFHVVMHLFWMALLQFTKNTFLSLAGSYLRSYTNFNASVAHVLKPCWSSSTRSQNTFFANLLISILCCRLR